eukprot:CAMPEP_0202845442 /NCGR_PEP_ID=MMETSP1389-20130828/70005_1 /ASSEMBLY_ACC=CAM_ASM_000865 /TAXON_ID=302021 /ORGANISM="Rhodomonas sp., Strain CCMP768" /LENGTH=178 /DNA_ID=CAMNT_0049522891 /DNA_START=82 /DNA_END=615 /DNA_ORIENTATION=-
MKRTGAQMKEVVKRTVRHKTQIWGRMLIDVAEVTWQRYFGNSHHFPQEESHARAGRDLAMKDPSFMRALFEALPGVDPEKALARVDALPNFNLAFPADDPAYARVPADIDDDDAEMDGSLSPFAELFAKGLLERLDEDSLEEQASWQAGRAFTPLRQPARFLRLEEEEGAAEEVREEE